MTRKEKRAEAYLNGNPIVKKFIDDFKNYLDTYYKKNYKTLTTPKVTIDVGVKYIRIWTDTNCWGFISRVDGVLKGEPIKKGDLLKPESWRGPAKHSRGNIIDGTADWDAYGPKYLTHGH